MFKSLRSFSRYIPWFTCVMLAILFAVQLYFGASSTLGHVIFFGAFVFLSVLGLRDMSQTKHAILRNYPVSGHLRFLFETFRPEIRQYFLETDTEKIPFSRNQRALVYQRSKSASDKRPLGTLMDHYQIGSEWLVHSLSPKTATKPEDLRITVGGPSCKKPYSISIFNISAMSFGALSANAIMALNKGAKMGGFAHDTGEGSVSDYHRRYGGDLTWQVASGYFGCRGPDGKFDAEKFALVANEDQVKMIEIKLSQGAKPGHGGVLPAAKITPEIARTRGIPMGEDCNSPAAHSAFTNPLELMAFIQQLRDLSGGKPIGMKLCIGKTTDWFAIVKAMLQTKITPDFIVIDGSEGGTGAAPVEFVDHVGTPMREGLRLVHMTLIGAGLRDQIKLGVAGKIVSAFDIVRACSLGADWCNSARGFMFAVGCIQSRSCHTDLCPTGVATQDAMRQRALDPMDKAHRVYHYHHNTLVALGELLAAAGFSHPSELDADMIIRRNEQGVAIPLQKQLFHLDAGELLNPFPEKCLDAHFEGMGNFWLQANPAQW